LLLLGVLRRVGSKLCAVGYERGGLVRPGVWRPLVQPSAAEQAVVKAVRRAELFVFLREPA
jgi:hypothetical protein